MRNAGRLNTILSLLAIAVLVAYGGTKPGPLVPTPEDAFFRVTPYVQHPATNAMTILWVSDRNAWAMLEVWRASDMSDDRFHAVWPREATELDYFGYSHPRQYLPAGTQWQYRYRVTDLEPDTEYGYRVYYGNGESYTNSFRTAPMAFRPVHFVAYSDSETQPSSTGDRVVWENFAVDHDTTPNSSRRYYIDQTEGYASNICAMVAGKPDFIVIAGDLAEKGSDQTHWDEFWRHNAGELNDPAGSTPILAAPGNHEYHGYYAADDYGERGMRKFLSYFEFEPNGASVEEDRQERFHRMDYGPVAMIFIDANNGRDYYSDSTSDMVNRENGTPNMQDTTQPLFQDRCRAPDFNPGSAQYRWLEEQLADAQTNKLFTFLVCHQCPFSVGYHGRLNGEYGTEGSKEYLSGAATRCLTNLVFKYGVDAWLCGHDELYEHSRLTGTETLPDGTTRSHTINIYDVGMGGDGLRGCNRTGRPNPYEVYRAHVDAPEVYDETGTLISGGKHYGHMDVNVTTNADGIWTATLTPTYVFVSSNTVTGKITFDRRTYPDTVVITNVPREQAEDPTETGRLWYENPRAVVLAENLPEQTGNYVSAFHGQGQDEYLGLTYSTNPLQFDLFRVDGTNALTTVRSVAAGEVTTAGFRGVAISKTLGIAMTLAYDTTATMYAFPLSGGNPVAVSRPSTHSFDSAAFSPDGQYLFSNALNGESSNQHYVKWAVSNGGTTLTKIGSISVGGRGRNLAYARIEGRDLVFALVDTGKIVVLDMTGDSASAWTATDLVTDLPNHSYGSLCVSGVNTPDATPHLTVATSINNGTTKADVLNVYALMVPASGAVTVSRIKSFDEDALTAAGFGDISDANRYGNTVYVTDDNATIYFARPDGKLYAYTTAARQAAIPYAITYTGLKGAANPNPATYTIEDAITFAAPGEVYGWVFTGWTPASIALGSTGAVSVAASWERRKFDVTVDGETRPYSYEDEVVFTAPDPTDANGMQVVALGTTFTAPVVTNEFTVTVTNDIAFAWDVLATNWWFETAETQNGSVEVAGSAAPSAPRTGGWVADGETLTLTAVPAAHYHFVEWTGDWRRVADSVPRQGGEQGAQDQDATENPLAVTMDRPRTIGAEFAIDTFTVTFEAGAHGTLAGEAVQTIDYGGLAVVPTVTPGAGYAFTGWSGDVTTPIASNATFTAQYAAIPYAITYTGLKGATNPNPATYTVEDAITFAAPGDVYGWVFTGWTPASIARGSTGAATVAASWERQKFDVTVNGETRQYSYEDTVVFTADAVVYVGATQFVCTGWAATNAEPESGTGTRAEFMVLGNVSFDWLWETNVVTLAQAVNAEDLEWTAGGAVEWQPEWSDEASDGPHDARCGAIPNGTNAWIATTVDGPGTLAFSWRSALASRNLKYQVMVDGDVQGMIIGTNGWHAVSMEILGSRRHEIRWRLISGRSGTAPGDWVALDGVAWTPAVPPTLAEALNTNLVWTTEGDVQWRGASRESLVDERDAWAVADGLGDNETATVQTRVFGSGVLVFDWAISCEEEYDWMVLVVDDEIRAYITGERGWMTSAIAIRGEGWHTVAWMYVKDEMDDAELVGENVARLDNVVWRSEGVPLEEMATDTPVPVPYSELETTFAPYLEQAEGDYEAAARLTGRNGYTIWQCYLAGLAPEDENSSFRARIEIVGDQPVVTWTPDTPELRATRTYTIYGKKTLLDRDWTPVTDANRCEYNFFKVKVRMK